MANYSTTWTLPPSFMPGDSSFKGTMPSHPSGETLLEKESPHGLPQKEGRDDGILYVTIHQAKHIHNICIYGNQDVYAKFLLTHCQDAVYPTRPVKAGGQNPVFNQSLEIPVSGGRDIILKCELWMMSCARNYLEDQLLGFVLVPLKTLYGKGEQTHEFCLTSTDLFYTPAGTVHLSLSFIGHNSIEVGNALQPVENKGSFCCTSPPNFQEGLMDCVQQSVTPTSMCKVEFLDLEAAAEDQHLVSMYYQLASGASFEECTESSSSSAQSGHVENASEHAAGPGSFSDKAHAEYVTSLEVKDPLVAVPLVHVVHASSVSSVDDEMAVSPREEESMHMPSYLSGLGEPSEMQEIATVNLSQGLICGSVEIPTPAGGLLAAECSSKQSLENAMKELAQETHRNSTCQTEGVTSFSTPLVNASAEPETSINQEHFVDLYLRSMQQFTDKLADMKFSFDIDSRDLAALRSVQVDRKVAEGRKKDGSKLYYGSRAFY